MRKKKHSFFVIIFFRIWSQIENCITIKNDFFVTQKFNQGKEQLAFFIQLYIIRLQCQHYFSSSFLRMQTVLFVLGCYLSSNVNNYALFQFQYKLFCNTNLHEWVLSIGNQSCDTCILLDVLHIQISHDDPAICLDILCHKTRKLQSFESIVTCINIILLTHLTFIRQLAYRLLHS